MKPVCVPCQRFYRPHVTGISFIEQMPIVEKAKAGTAEPEKWQPYKLWRGDLWKCRGCGAETIIGTGFAPVRERHHSDFAEMATKLGASIKINDC